MTDPDTTDDKLLFSATITVSKDKNNCKKLEKLMEEEEKKNEATERLWKTGQFVGDEKED